MLFLVLTPSSNVHWETAELAAVDFFEAGFLDSATAAAAAAAAMSVTRQKNRLSVWPCAHVRHRYQQGDSCLEKTENQKLFFVAFIVISC